MQIEMAVPSTDYNTCLALIEAWKRYCEERGLKFNHLDWGPSWVECEAVMEVEEEFCAFAHAWFWARGFATEKF